jgi:prophage regulatory protein
MQPTTTALLRLRQVCAKLSVSRSTVYSWLNPKSPYFRPEFPSPLKLGGRAIFWTEAAIDEWIAGAIASAKRNNLSVMSAEESSCLA